MESDLPIDPDSFSVSGNYQEITLFLSQFRIKFSKQKSFPFSGPFKVSLLTFLQKSIEFSPHDPPSIEKSNLISEALWLISNFVATIEDSNSDKIITPDLIRNILLCLDSKYADIVENSLWALANISACDFICRDEILKSKLFFVVNKIKSKLPFLENFEVSKGKAKRNKILKPLAWLLSNIFRGPPFPDFPMIKPYIGTLIELLYESDSEIINYMVITWRQIVQNIGEKEISILNNFGLMTKILGVLVQNLYDQNKIYIVQECLKIVGDIIVESTKEQTQIYFDCNIVKVLERVLKITDKDSLISGCWILSNLALGCETHLDALMGQEIYQRMIRNLESKHATIQNESLHFFSNLVKFSNEKQKRIMIKRGILGNLFNLANVLIQFDKKLILVLSAIDTLLGCSHWEKITVEYAWRNSIDKINVIWKGKLGIVDICENIQKFFDESDLKVLGSFFNITFYPFQED